MCPDLESKNLTGTGHVIVILHVEVTHLYEEEGWRRRYRGGGTEKEVSKCGSRGMEDQVWRRRYGESSEEEVWRKM